MINHRLHELLAEWRIRFKRTNQWVKFKNRTVIKKQHNLYQWQTITDLYSILATTALCYVMPGYPLTGLKVIIICTTVRLNNHFCLIMINPLTNSLLASTLQNQQIKAKEKKQNIETLKETRKWWLTLWSQSSCRCRQTPSSTAWSSSWVEKQSIQTSLQTRDWDIQTPTEAKRPAAQSLRWDQYQRMPTQPQHSFRGSFY